MGLRKVFENENTLCQGGNVSHGGRKNSARLYSLHFFLSKIYFQLVYTNFYIWQSNLVIHIYTYFSNYDLTQNIEYSSLCCTIESFIHAYIYTSLHLLFPNSQLIPPSPCSLANYKSTTVVVFRKETPLRLTGSFVVWTRK